MTVDCEIRSPSDATSACVRRPFSPAEMRSFQSMRTSMSL